MKYCPLWFCLNISDAEEFDKIVDKVAVIIRDDHVSYLEMGTRIHGTWCCVCCGCSSHIVLEQTEACNTGL